MSAGRFARWVRAAIVVVASLLARPALASFELEDTGWEGCSELLALARAELGSGRVLPIRTLDWRTITPADAILVIHPTRPIDPDEAAAFMRAGGRLGVLDDHGVADRMLRTFKVERVGLPAAPRRFLRGNKALAIATPIREPSSAGGAGTHPTVVDVPAVVLNHATGFVHPDLTAVLEVIGDRPGSEGAAESAAVAIAGQVDRGRLFAVGDPSAFMNLMLRFPGNRAFARGIVRYLGDGDPSAPRAGRLFVVVNDFDEASSFAGDTPLEKSLLRYLRVMAVGLEELRDRGFPWWLHSLAAASCALAAIGWFSRAAMKPYAPRLPRFARSVPLAAQGGVAGRLAVLAAPGSAPELAMLELRSALIESLALVLGTRDSAPLAELLELASKRGLVEAALLERLKRVERWMDAAESTVVRGGGSTVRRSQVLDAALIVDEVLATAMSERPREPRG
ncbi:MAG: DUF4350 domain-containing protein [Deltaproteobacteria bacterium]|nr:DUF4350 domain-containing protein [Deltaproteobacteria bacterium]